jgi:hypothetical protein
MRNYDAKNTNHELGYSPAEGEAITAVRSAIGRETGYTCCACSASNRWASGSMTS